MPGTRRAATTHRSHIPRDRPQTRCGAAACRSRSHFPNTRACPCSFVAGRAGRHRSTARHRGAARSRRVVPPTPCRDSRPRPQSPTPKSIRRATGRRQATVWASSRRPRSRPSPLSARSVSESIRAPGRCCRHLQPERPAAPAARDAAPANVSHASSVSVTRRCSGEARGSGCYVKVRLSMTVDEDVRGRVHVGARRGTC